MDNNNNKKYLNYAIFLLIVVVVVGLAVSHSRHMRNLVDSMAGPNRAARVAAAKELVKAEQFMDAVTGETVETRTAVVQALEDWATEPRVPRESRHTPRRSVPPAAAPPSSGARRRGTGRPCTTLSPSISTRGP